MIYWSEVLLPIVAFEVYPDVALAEADVGSVISGRLTVTELNPSKSSSAAV